MMPELSTDGVRFRSTTHTSPTEQTHEGADPPGGVGPSRVRFVSGAVDGERAGASASAAWSAYVSDSWRNAWASDLLNERVPQQAGGVRLRAMSLTQVPSIEEKT